MRLRLSAAAAALAAAAMLQAGEQVPVGEVEPNGFTVPSPQALGAIGPAGVVVQGALATTHPSGLDPGDRDGYAFTVPSGGVAVVLESAADIPFLLALAEEVDGTVRPLATGFGRSPVALDLPAADGARTLRVGVAAFGEGPAAAYTLRITNQDLLPAWSGEPCGDPVGEAEGDASVFDGADLGDFTRVLCGAGVLDAAPPEEGAPGDEDRFRFRNVLPTPARVVLVADPGEVRLSVDSLAFVGSVEVASVAAGERRELVLPPLLPGATYAVRLSTPPGSPARAYAFHIEPVAPPPPPPDLPASVDAARIRFDADPARTSFRVLASFDPQALPPPDPTEAAEVRVRVLRADLGFAALDVDATGRLVWRARPGAPGLRRLVLDPFLGTLTAKGRGGDLGAAEDARVDVRFSLGAIRLSGGADGSLRRGGRLLVVR